MSLSTLPRFVSKQWSRYLDIRQTILRLTALQQKFLLIVHMHFVFESHSWRLEPTHCFDVAEVVVARPDEATSAPTLRSKNHFADEAHLEFATPAWQDADFDDKYLAFCDHDSSWQCTNCTMIAMSDETAERVCWLCNFCSA